MFSALLIFEIFFSLGNNKKILPYNQNDKPISWILECDSLTIGKVSNTLLFVYLVGVNELTFPLYLLDIRNYYHFVTYTLYYYYILLRASMYLYANL